MKTIIKSSVTFTFILSFMFGSKLILNEIQAQGEEVQKISISTPW